VVVISPDNDVVTGLIVQNCPPDKQQFLLDYNVGETERLIKHLPGFVSASFHKSLDGQRMTEYVQWRSLEHFQAARENPEFHAHIPVVAAVAQVEWDLYRVIGSVAASPPATIATTNDVLTVIVVLSGEPDKLAQAFDIAAGRTDSFIRHLPGFVSASWHRNRDGTRVAEYIQWRSRDHFQAFRANPDWSSHVQEVHALVHAEFSMYQLCHVTEAQPVQA